MARGNQAPASPGHTSPRCRVNGQDPQTWRLLCGVGGLGRDGTQEDEFTVFSPPRSPPRPTLGHGVAIKRGVQFHATPLASEAHHSRGKTGPRPRPCMEMCLSKERPVSGFAPGMRALEIETEPGREEEQVMETLTDSKARREAERSPERGRQTDSRWAPGRGGGGSCCGDTAPATPRGTESTAARSPHGPAAPTGRASKRKHGCPCHSFWGTLSGSSPAPTASFSECVRRPRRDLCCWAQPPPLTGGVLRMQTRWGIPEQNGS